MEKTPLNYETHIVGYGNVTGGWGIRNSVNSPRDKWGHLLPQLNPYSLIRNRLQTFRYSLLPNGGAVRCCDAISGPRGSIQGKIRPVPRAEAVSLNNELYGKMQGQLHFGDANLLMNSVDFKQNRDMVRDRLKKVAHRLDDSLYALAKYPNAKRRWMSSREPLANQVLENDFGWQPVIQDISNGLHQLCQQGVPDTMISVNAKRPFAETSYTRWKDAWGDSVFTSTSNIGVERWRAQYWVAVDNPNLWLLNRAGFLNPQVTMWDKVPWSFVVNWFFNANQLIQQFSDEYGLSVNHTCVTRKTYLWHTERVFERYHGIDYVGESVVTQKVVDRTIGEKIAPIPQFRVPNLDWGLVRITSALVVQKFAKFNRFLRVL